MRLLPGKLLRMKAKRDRNLDQQQVPVVPGPDIVRCHCGYAKEEGIIVRLPLIIPLPYCGPN